MISRIRTRVLNKDEGFTLIELLVVIIIIGILAAIAIPVFLSQRNKGNDVTAKSDAKNFATAEETILADKGYYADATNEADVDVVAAGFKKSTNTASIKAVGLSSATAKVTTADTSTFGYCITSMSKSGTSYYWNSATGGLTTTLCP
jgi:type IV pilus assembly protein PilA